MDHHALRRLDAVEARHVVGVGAGEVRGQDDGAVLGANQVTAARCLGLKERVMQLPDPCQ